MEKIKYKTKEEIREKLQSHDYELISKVLNGKYKKHTIRHQICGYRTLKEPVILAANKVIAAREALITQGIENQQ